MPLYDKDGEITFCLHCNIVACIVHYSVNIKFDCTKYYAHSNASQQLSADLLFLIQYYTWHPNYQAEIIF
jgi:hypothetical protein